MWKPGLLRIGLGISLGFWCVSWQGWVCLRMRVGAAEGVSAAGPLLTQLLMLVLLLCLPRPLQFPTIGFEKASMRYQD